MPLDVRGDGTFRYQCEEYVAMPFYAPGLVVMTLGSDLETFGGDGALESWCIVMH